MKLSFCQLFLFLFIILNYFQCQYCTNFDDNDQKKIFRKLYDATNRTLSSLLPPLCYEILFNQNNVQNDYISPGGLSGRVTPVGTFTTYVLALEYLYGILCPIPTLPPRLNTIKSFDLVHIAYDENYLITQSEFTVNLTGNKELTFFTVAAFDENYKLCGYDGQIRNIGLTLDASTQQEQQTNITLICTVAQLYCNGSLQQYASVNACIEFLTNNVPYGSFDRGDQGNVVCRSIHTNFVPLLPSVHCPHVGPTGGGACTNKTVDFYYNQTDFIACAHKYNKKKLI
jgi:hypothetical protein